MSFGRPPSLQETFTLTPPQRGSFPLDHDGDCKTPMIEYLKCLKANGQDNGKCRLLSRRYLECRMDNGLMERDSMHNLGLGDVGEPSKERIAATTSESKGEKQKEAEAKGRGA